jgi:SAM-dependent methyltransferase
MVARQMAFAVSAAAYDSFMGRYSAALAPVFAEFADVDSSCTVLDVGCGPGALTAELIRRLGVDAVWAVDPSQTFVDATRDRYPGVRVQPAAAERLPFAAGLFDATLAQLVVHFMTDPVAGLREMARTTKDGGLVAACVWDHATGSSPLHVFWEAARQLDPEVEGESHLAGAGPGQLGDLLTTTGLEDVDETLLTVDFEHPSFEDWWHPFTFGVGPAGAYVARIGPSRRARLRERCRAMLPRAPFVVSAGAWAARGRKSS